MLVVIAGVLTLYSQNEFKTQCKGFGLALGWAQQQWNAGQQQIWESGQKWLEPKQIESIVKAEAVAMVVGGTLFIAN